MFLLTCRRGVTDPVRRMKIDRTRAVRGELDGETVYFCSEDCRRAYESGIA